jgi:hypothetical protein
VIDDATHFGSKIPAESGPRRPNVRKKPDFAGFALLFGALVWFLQIRTICTVSAAKPMLAKTNQRLRSGPAWGCNVPKEVNDK